MRKKWTKGIALALSAIMMFSLAGCGTKNTAPAKEQPAEAAKESEPAKAAEETAVKPAEEAAKPAENIEIRLTSRWGGEETLSTYFNQKITEFNALNNGITIVADNVTDEQQYFDKLSAQIGAGTQPNIFINYGGTSIGDYLDANLLLDLTPYLDQDKEWKDSFMPLFDKWQKDKATYGVPVMLYTILLYYNQEILDANGITPPETIEDLQAACDTLVANGITPFQLGESSNFRAGHLLNNLCYKTYGGDIVAKLASREVKYDSPEMLAMYKIIKDWNEKGYFGKNAVSVDNNGEKAAFLSGQSAFRYDGAWFVGELKGTEVDGKADVMAFPYFKDKAEFKTNMQGGSGQGFSITDSGDQAVNDAAVEVVKFLTSKEYYAGLEKASDGGVYPVMFTSDPATKIDDMTVKVKGIIETATVFQGDMQESDPETHMLNTVRAALQGLFIGNSPEDCAKEIVDQQEVK